MEGLDVVPVLLEEGDEEVDAQHGIGNEFIIRHFDVTNGNTTTEDLFKLEFDGCLGFFNLGGQIIRVSNWGGEFTGFIQTRAQETRDLLDDDIGSEEEIVTGSEFLDFLLTLVELFQVISGTEIDTKLFSLVAMNIVTQNANLQRRTGGMRKTNSSRETLVMLNVVIL